MAVTSQLFEAYLKCPTKCFLRARSEADAGNPYATWMEAQNKSYRSEGRKRLTEGSLRDDCVISPPDIGHFKVGKWRLAVDIIACTQNLESSIDAVERLPSGRRGKPTQFIPIRFIFTNKLCRDDKLLLAFDALTLAEFMGRNILAGKIIHGDDHTAARVKTSPLMGEVRKLIKKIAALLSSSSPPDLTLNRHCAACEFQARCRQAAIEKDDLSLLSGMTEKECKRLRDRGIFTVTQLSYTFRPRRNPKRVAGKREKYHHSLQALAIRQNKIHIVGSLDLKIEGTPVYLDVEGLPDRDFHYLIGVRVKTAHEVVQYSLWADNWPEKSNCGMTFSNCYRESKAHS